MGSLITKELVVRRSLDDNLRKRIKYSMKGWYKTRRESKIHQRESRIAPLPSLQNLTVDNTHTLEDFHCNSAWMLARLCEW